jgi:hypothetical protein
MYVPLNLEVCKFIPSEFLKKHYTARLSKFSFSILESDCYDDIQRKCCLLSEEKKNEILSWDGWLEIERLTIESWFKVKEEK